MITSRINEILAISRFVSIWVLTICPIVVIRVSGRMFRSLPRSPSEMAEQQPMISMALTCGPVPSRSLNDVEVREDTIVVDRARLRQTHERS